MKRYLEPGEEVQLEARPHGAALARPLARALAVAATGGLVVVVGSRFSWAFAMLGAFQVAAAAALALASVLRWDRTHVVVTTDKLLVIHGVVRRRAAAVRLARVGPIEIEESALGRLFGYGTVIAGDLEIPYVAAPHRLHQLLG